MKVQCCVCGKVRRAGGWTHAHADELRTDNVSHGYCPFCLARAQAQVSEQSPPHAVNARG